MEQWSRAGASALLLALSALGVGVEPALAEVVAHNDIGFVSRNAIDVRAAPGEVWRRLLDPASWWLPAQTFSGDSANLSIDPVANGCFCEKLPAGEKAVHGGGRSGPGSVQHMRVVFVDPPHALRMSGGIGPLQSEAVNATLTITLKPGEHGTRILMEYVVGGFMRYDSGSIGPAIDHMLAAQLVNLGSRLGPIASAAVPSAPAVRMAGSDDGRAPVPATGDTGADNGLIRKSGRAWSLSLTPGATAALPGVNPASLPTDDTATIAPRPAAAVVPVAQPATKVKAPAKPRATKSTLDPDDVPRDDVNTAFDTALGDHTPQ